MKTHIVSKKINLNNTFLFRQKNILLLFFVMIVAVIFGALINKTTVADDLYNKVIVLLSDFFYSVNNNSKPEIYSGLLLSSLACFIIIMLLSTSVIGAPLIYTVIFFKLAGLSNVLFILYSEYGLNGLEFAVLVLLPGKYFMILALLILADSSTHISNVHLKEVQKKPGIIKKYFVILALVLLLLMLSVTVDFFALSTVTGLFDSVF